MSTNRHIDRICGIAVVAALLISVLFVNGAALGVQVQTSAMGYEDRLFDTAKVHTIDIVIDDWEGFLETAQSEAYTACDVVIDGEAFRNVGIRGKGNTSLMTVASMDSDRYSFKIEFDQYEAAQSYYGLDKLSLNNLIQDNTMMKDYLTYRLMNAFGVAAPLCSYVYITVNGEDWGLYLAVEAVEESFLQRNFGSSYGDLYKPDSMEMGGGRGNGRDFDPAAFMEASEKEGPSLPEGFDPTQMGGRMPGENSGGAGTPTPPDGNASQFRQQGGKLTGGGMGSAETKLQYIDDDPDSYSAVFSSAKTDVTAADRNRLIAALKSLSEGDPGAVDAEAVLRYFVVHNFVVNGDSYTGSMIHNYYLYEENGQLSMIPWDYNLAFGTFQGNQASNAVNDDIDAPLSVTGGDRPMIDWIFSSEKYTGLYHQYFREFLDTVDAAAVISQAKELIAPYVQKDPTKFCTWEAFETGVQTLETFCELRSRSVELQLAGEEADVDASAINLSDMGTMGGGGFGNKGQMPENADMQSTGSPQMPEAPANMPGGADPMGRQPGSQANSQFPGGQFPEGKEAPSFPGQDWGQPTQTGSSWMTFALTAAVLAAGLLFVFKFKR